MRLRRLARELCAGIDLPPNNWNLDQATIHDHPAACGRVVREKGSPTLEALIHRQGSASFLMWAAARDGSRGDHDRFERGVAPPGRPVLLECEEPRAALRVARLTRYLDPRWGDDAPTPTAAGIVALVRLFHHECDNTVCKTRG
jgi:hypothetical protein